MSNLQRALLVIASISCGFDVVRAQSFYVDCGANPPSSNYAAAASAPGVWNAMPWAADSTQSVVGIYGEPLAIELALHSECDFSLCTGGIPGDDGALLGDWFNGDCYTLNIGITMRNLQPGTYRVHLYGYSENACQGSIAHTVFYALDNQVYGQFQVVPWTGSFATGNHIEEIVTHASTTDFAIHALGGPYTGLAGFQFELVDAAPTAFCFGTQGACPCGPGAAGRGCPTSYDQNGAQLSANGIPSVASDTLTLHADGVTNSFMTIVQGSAFTNAGQGIGFGDGLLCAGGSVLRLKLKFGNNGVLDYPEAGETPISVLGSNAAGATRVYQVWFRDSPAFCTSGTFNLTNGVAVVWR